ncbi:Oidioi.mRNA.OKI2018_I69.chr1.g1618.t1.cds [Oikopleura dioica]|uniref:Oidioi.mRNA.OKI2018_I69.chr1.g1618.t1.cds n=1 Tax=Oikopleura dioica TaxID=34765 RepID=A0ABN7SXN1_OIKDI|nr:Oidioi.mRNA.OKI2018_I69.chr1.g1618.t1.cds [Oikopleura dioica]
MENFQFGPSNRYKCIRELRQAKLGESTLYWIVEDKTFAGELKILKAIALLSEKVKSDTEDEVKLLKQMNNEFIVKLLDDVSFTGPNSVPYRGLILEYLSGGDLGQFLANMKKDLESPSDDDDTDEEGEKEEAAGEDDDDGEVMKSTLKSTLKSSLKSSGSGTSGNGIWSENDALRLAAQIVFAMDYLHKKKKQVHKELNTENILISADGKKIKILDLHICSGGMTGGPSDYFYPPETFKRLDTGNVTFKRDIWSMGVIFHMLCTFENPFAGEHPPATWNNIIQNKRTPSKLPQAEMEALVNCCLKENLEDRVGNASLLMNHGSIKSLVKQLKNRVEPADMKFSLDETKTLEVVNDTLADENAELKRQLKALNSSDLTFGKKATSKKILKAISDGVESFNLKFMRTQEYEVAEGEYKLKIASFDNSKRDEWKLWITKNDKTIPLRANADCIQQDGRVLYSMKNIEPNENDGEIKCGETEEEQEARKSENPDAPGTEYYIRWNITILPQE